MSESKIDEASNDKDEVKENTEEKPELPTFSADIGYCSQSPMSWADLRKEIRKPPIDSSDYHASCTLPKRFEYPHWVNSYGCQVSRQHPFFRTTSNDYGWYAPGIHCIPSAFYPTGQKFSNLLCHSGMYRNYSLNTGLGSDGL